MPSYPFEPAYKGVSPSLYNARKAKTAGQTGIMRTKERLAWQQKHLEQAKMQHKQALEAAKKYWKIHEDHSARVNSIKRKIASATPAEKTRLKQNLKSAISNMNKSKSHAAVFRKRGGKYAEEIRRVSDHINKNKMKLNAQVAARAAKQRR